MEKKLTVVQTLPALHSGGVERGTLEIARALVAAGHRSIVISNGGRLVEQLVREGSEHIALPVHRKSLMSLFQVKPFRCLLESIQPDIVHARSRVPAWIAWLALRRLPMESRPRFITTVHGMYSVSPYSAIMTKGEKVIAVSSTVCQYIRDNYPACPAENIELIYRGVDPEEFPFGYKPSTQWLQTWRSEFPSLAGKIILTLPGRITRLKGHETFIRLIRSLVVSGLPVHGLIVGGAEEKKQSYLTELKALITALGLESNVTFTGLRNDIREILSQSQLVFSLSTKPETFGRTTLEALSLGQPVIGWNVGGVGEILSAMFPDGLIPYADEEKLLKTTRHLIQHPPVPARNTQFLLSHMQQQTLSMYQRMLERSRENLHPE